MSKVFKNVLLFILIIACVFNVVIKLVRRFPLKEELQASAQYISEQAKDAINKK